ncbi:MAG: 2-C-methyl-D-erythritol 4-phosphate cytidylyltransferase [Chloroflexota bacterium]|nr:2-C-methyl-D-erythritol 4-phosphate cytidylyltransferase [Chloroflexota bacterium]
MSRIGAIVLAAGASRRMGGVEKISAEIAGKPLIAHTVDIFQRCPSIDEIVIVLSEDKLDFGTDLVKKFSWSKIETVCPGGARRQDSVNEGLKQLNNPGWVVIHDGARPCLDVSLIERGLVEARDTGAAIAAIPATDTIKVVSPDGFVDQTPPRGDLWAVQTPQIFRFDIISEAYRHANDDVTDDASLVERLGYKVKVFSGSYDNIKVTTPEDLVTARAIIESRR